MVRVSFICETMHSFAIYLFVALIQLSSSQDKKENEELAVSLNPPAHPDLAIINIISIV